MGIEVALPSFLFRFPLLLCITFHFSCQDWGFVHQAIPLQLWQIPAYMYTPLFSHLFMVRIYQVCHDFFLVANAGTQNLNFWPLQIFTVERIWERLTEKGSDSKFVILSFN